MEKNCYAIKDTVTGEFDDPFYMKNNGEAVRALRAGVNSSQETKLSKFANDLALYSLGSLDTQTGAFVSKVEFVCNAVDLKE